MSTSPLARLRARRAGQGSPGPSLATPGSSRANRLSFSLTTIAGLASTWALICVARALGSAAGMMSDAEPGLGRGLLIQAGLAVLVAGIAHLLAGRIARDSSAQLEADIRARGLRHLFYLGPTASTDARTGSTVSLLTDGAERVALYRQTFLAPTIAAAAGPALSLLILGIAVDPLPALVLGLAVILTPLLIGWSHGKLRASSSDSRRARMRLAAEYLDAIQGLTTLTLARAARRRAQILADEGESNRRAVMGVLAGNQMVIFITDILFSLFLVTTAAGLALSRLSAGAIDVGGALAIVLVTYMLLEPLDHVGAFFYVGMGGLANQRALRTLLGQKRSDIAAEASVSLSDAEPHVTGQAAVPAASEPSEGDTAAEAATSAAPGQAVEGGATGAILGSTSRPRSATEQLKQHRQIVAMKDVSAQWNAEAGTVLSDVDLEVTRGIHLAVVGPSGSGKSTLLSLLSGDLLPSEGQVIVDGTQLAADTQDEVRAASAVVAQSTWLFTGTIADNLRLALPEASEEQMWEALEAAHLAHDVRAMPEGLNTEVGEAGMSLSGGQAQRLSLARAILSGRELLLLDEPTSQVDLDSEDAMLKAIEALSQHKTIITVSHRSGALTYADEVLTVADGKVSQA